MCVKLRSIGDLSVYMDKSHRATRRGLPRAKAPLAVIKGSGPVRHCLRLWRGRVARLYGRLAIKERNNEVVHGVREEGTSRGAGRRRSAVLVRFRTNCTRPFQTFASQCRSPQRPHFLPTSPNPHPFFSAGFASSSSSPLSSSSSTSIFGTTCSTTSGFTSPLKPAFLAMASMSNATT